MATTTSSSGRWARLGRQARAELAPDRLVPSVLAGGLNGVLEIALATSFAALVFSGSLSPYLARGIGMTLFSATASLAIVGLLSSYPLTISSNQDVPAAIVAVAAAAIAAALVGTGSEFATVAVVIALTTLAAALLFLLLGTFRLTNLVRFLPYPVIGGFLAGTGWLLATGGIAMMADESFSLATLGSLVAPGTLLHWLPGFALGLLIFALSRRVQHFLFMPAVIVGTFALFYAVAFAMGATLEELSAGGWLLGPFPAGGLWQPIGRAELALVDWSAVWPQVPSLAVAVGISAIALLLNATGLELAIRRDLDLNREMRSAGVANLAAGLGGGFIGYHLLSMSALNARLGASSRLVGPVAALITGAALLAGGSALSIFPKMVFGALLVYLGVSFLWEWTVDAWKRLPRVDYFIVVGIFVIVVAVGFLEGVAVGVVAAVVMFVISYSRSSIVKHELTGSTFKSRVTRGPDERAVLQAVGDEAYYLQLQGFVFFGTAYSLLEQVRARVTSRPTRFVVLDFQQVIGIDSTALLSFDKMVQFARDEQVLLVFAGLSPNWRTQFTQAGVGEEAGVVRFESTFDRAAEWVEDQLCEEGVLVDRTLDDYLQAIVPGEATSELLNYLERREVAAGTHLIRQDDEPDVMFFIESGQVTAQLEEPGKPPTRLETMRGGRTVGELGFYLGTRRSAAVVADEPTVVYILTQEKLTEMEREAADVAYAFHRIVVHLLGERVLHLVRAVDAFRN